MRAVLDVGTNSVRLLAAKVSQGRVEPVTKEVRVTRLGQGVDHSKRLAPEAMARTLAALRELFALIPPGVPVDILATSAVRDAGNREEFARLVQEKLGISLQILSGAREAELSFLGAVSALNLPDPITVVDIGGGSTEIFTGTNAGGLLGGSSVQIGAVRLLERHPRNSPELHEEIQAALAPAVQENLKFEPKSFVAVGGTANSLAAIIQNLAEYSDDKVAGFSFSLAELADCYAYLGRLSLEERRQIPSLQAGREDIIVYGAAILLHAARMMGVAKIHVSTSSLLHGYLISQLTSGQLTKGCK